MSVCLIPEQDVKNDHAFVLIGCSDSLFGPNLQVSRLLSHTDNPDFKAVIARVCLHFFNLLHVIVESLTHETCQADVYVRRGGGCVLKLAS